MSLTNSKLLQNSLYFKCAPRKQRELLIIDAETLVVTGIAVLEGKDWSSSVMFSDGENLGMITAGKDVIIVISNKLYCTIRSIFAINFLFFS